MLKWNLQRCQDMARQHRWLRWLPCRWAKKKRGKAGQLLTMEYKMGHQRLTWSCWQGKRGGGGGGGGQPAASAAASLAVMDLDLRTLEDIDGQSCQPHCPISPSAGNSGPDLGNGERGADLELLGLLLAVLQGLDGVPSMGPRQLQLLAVPTERREVQQGLVLLPSPTPWLRHILGL